MKTLLKLLTLPFWLLFYFVLSLLVMAAIGVLSLAGGAR